MVQNVSLQKHRCNDMVCLFYNKETESQREPVAGL